jgi:hypothetical protein
MRLNRLRHLLGAWKATGTGFVEDDLAVDGDLEDALRSCAQLDARYDGGPSIGDLGCRTDSLVQIVSRDAVFDHHCVLWIDHSSRAYEAPSGGGAFGACAH